MTILNVLVYFGLILDCFRVTLVYFSLLWTVVCCEIHHC